MDDSLSAHPRSVPAPFGAVYAVPRVLHPLLTGREFLPPPAPAAEDDWDTLTALAARHDWHLPLRWRHELRRPGTALVLTDAAQRICWVNAGFSRMTGYPAAEALGRRPGFLQGPGTEAAVREGLRQRLQQARPFVGMLLNYRRSGQPYYCYVRIRPVRNTAGVVTHFLAFEHELLLAVAS